MSALLAVLSLLVPGTVPGPLAQNPEATRAEWVEVEGEVELDQVAALASAERRAIEVLWERFGPRWQDRAGRLVPEERVTAHLAQWIARDFERLPVVAAEGVESIPSSVGTVWRKRYRVQVAGPQADRFLAQGERQAGLVSARYHRSYMLIAALAALLFWIGHRLDRATRGYLSWRIRLGTLAGVLLGAWLLYPHG
ncbi:MAG: hypothetical protein R3F30_03690 [Planctomycetota bacterium]